MHANSVLEGEKRSYVGHHAELFGADAMSTRHHDFDCDLEGESTPCNFENIGEKTTEKVIDKFGADEDVIWLC